MKSKNYFSWVPLPFLLFVLMGWVPLGLGQLPRPNCTSRAEFDFNKFNLNDVPTCFCELEQSEKGDRRDTYRVDCLWGSDPKDLAVAIRGLAQSGSKLSTIHANSFSSGDTGIPAEFFHQLGLAPQKINVEKCVGRLLFEPTAFGGVENEVLRMNISRCQLNHIPLAFRKLKALTFLQLRECQISDLTSRAFLGMDSLDMLDLTYNGMRKIHDEAFEGLEDLETLVLGPGNRLDEKILPSLNSLRSLQAFWMPFGRIKRIKPGSMRNLSNLKELMLPRNHIESLSAGSFSGLEELEELDLRVNLIHVLDDSVFVPLKRLRKLYLDANYIGSLSPETFSGLDKLEELGLAFNEMELISGSTFAPMSHLELLDLHHNVKLKILSPRAFRGLDKLKLLNMSETGVAVLDNELFHPLIQLEVLDLSSSPIQVIGPETFVFLENLKELYLSNTKIGTLPASTFGIMDLNVLDISGNPWECNSELIDLIYWIQKGYRVGLMTGKKTRIRKLFNTQCATPFNMKGKPIAWVDLGTMLRE